MVRLRSDREQILALAGGIWLLNVLVGTPGGERGIGGQALFLMFVVVAATAFGWRRLEWERPGFRVALATTVAGSALVLVYTVFTGRAFQLLTAGAPVLLVVNRFLLPVVLAETLPLLFVGGVLSRRRARFFGRLDADDTPATPDGRRGTASGAPSEGGAGTRRSAAASDDGPRHELGAGDPTEWMGSATDGGAAAGARSDQAPTVATDQRPSRSAAAPESAFDVSFTDFDVGAVIGSGGNADVHLATVALPDGTREVALKTPRVAGGDTVGADFFEQFREEAQTWSRLDDHETVVTVYDWGERPQPWIALEYMDAGDLNDWQGHLDYYGKLAVLEDVTEAVHHAHTHGVNHTDLKPGNVLFTERTGEGGEPWVAKVGDWGLANVLLEHSQSVEGFTPDYAAPEQVDPDQFGRTDHQTDIYQLGVVAYELLTGQLPFDKGHQAATINAILNDQPDPPTTLDPDLPPEVDDVLLQALAKEKTDRQDAVIYLRDAFREL